MTQPLDGFQLREALRTGEDDATESSGGEDKEEREVESFGFGLAPVAEALVEGLLLGRQWVGLLGCGGAMACEGFGRCS